MTRRLAVSSFALLLFAGGCSSPTTPAPPVQVPDVATPTFPSGLSGVWRMAVTGRRCSNNSCSNTAYTNIELRIAESGGTYAGLINFRDLSPFDQLVELTGSAASEGFVSFGGSIRRPEDLRDETEVRALRVRPDPVTGLSGEFDLRQHIPSGGTAWSFIGTILSASHQPLPSLSATSLAGHWSGRAVITDCSGHCRSNNSPGREREIELVLGAGASAMNGHVRVSLSACTNCWVPVSGSANSTTLTLLSAPYAHPDRPEDVLEVQSWTSSLDVFGRLKGTFRLASQENIAVSPFDVAYQQEFNLLWLMRD